MPKNTGLHSTAMRKTHVSRGWGSFCASTISTNCPNCGTSSEAFIGPRPERRFYINQIIEKDPRYIYLYQIRPGVTSYATLYNGYTDTLEKMLRRLELDLYYLENRSWLLDAKILINTFLNIAIGKKF